MKKTKSWVVAFLMSAATTCSLLKTINLIVENVYTSYSQRCLPFEQLMQVIFECYLKASLIPIRNWELIHTLAFLSTLNHLVALKRDLMAS